MLDKIAITLPSGVVIDKGKLNNVKADDAAATLKLAYSLGVDVVFVPLHNIFFQPKSLLALIEAGDRNWKLVAEKLDVKITPDEVRTLNAAVDIRKRLMDTLKSTYEFADVPDGYDVTKRTHISGQNVRRLSANNGTTGEYSIGLKTLKNIWGLASNKWAGHQKGVASMSVSASGYSRMATVKDQQVDVGCQVIDRYELEQFALSQGWDVPEMAVK